MSVRGMWEMLTFVHVGGFFRVCGQEVKRTTCLLLQSTANLHNVSFKKQYVGNFTKGLTRVFMGESPQNTHIGYSVYLWVSSQGRWIYVPATSSENWLTIIFLAKHKGFMLRQDLEKVFLCLPGLTVKEIFMFSKNILLCNFFATLPKMCCKLSCWCFSE